jgi:DNA-binding HxlR family transcriptional regulator
VLTERLADLRQAGIVERGDDGYQLTDRGRELFVLLAPIERWASAWR